MSSTVPAGCLLYSSHFDSTSQPLSKTMCMGGFLCPQRSPVFVRGRQLWPHLPAALHGPVLGPGLHSNALLCSVQAEDAPFAPLRDLCGLITCTLWGWR